MLAFDNDEANDWAYGLDEVTDLSLVRATLENAGSSTGGYLEQGVAAEALAACEVIARLRGRPGYTNAYTAKVDQWVALHPRVPPPDLVDLGTSVIDRVLGPESELRELWEEAGDEGWRAAVLDLRARIAS